MNSADVLLATLRLGGAPLPEQLQDAWPRADLRAVRRLVEFEGCALWTYRRLRQLDVLATLDPDFAGWLSGEGRDAAARNLLIDAEAEAVARTLGRIGVPGVFMKGTARRLVAERYPLADARRTSDVDVLVPERQAWDLWYALRRMGYERTNPSKRRPEHHHLPALMNDRRVGVEIHTTHAQGIDPGVSWQRHFTNGATVLRGGVTYRVPSPTELLWTATAHALLIPDLAFFLVRLLDTALIWASGAAIDWDEVARRLDAKEIVDGGAAAAWLGAARVLAGQAELPAALVGRVASYDLSRELRLRLAVLRRVAVPAGWRKALAWWSSEVARR